METFTDELSVKPQSLKKLGVNLEFHAKSAFIEVRKLTKTFLFDRRTFGMLEFSIYYVY